MAFEFRLPDIGEGVVEGEVVKWLIKVGDLVREDQPMVEVMTDKATVEIPSPKAGRVLSITAPEGQLCKVGQVMVSIEVGATGDAAAPAAPSLASEPRQVHGKTPEAAPVPAPREETVRIAAPVGGSPHDASGNGKVLATPATRKLARDLGVDLTTVRGSGDSGRITVADVHGAAARPASAGRVADAAIPHAIPSPDLTPLPPPSPMLTPVPAHPIASDAGDQRIPLRGVRRKIAENMARSKRTAAHFTYVDEADVTELVALRTRARARAEERAIKLSFLPFIVKAVVSGLKKYPIINSTLDEERGEIVLRKHYHVGVAAASEAGLIVPVIKDADQKSLFQIAAELGELSERAKAGKASREELTGSTFTISSLGALGGVLATPIINHPEVAILGVHKIQEKPAVVGGQIVIRSLTNFSISLDHRVVDGYEGARFLQHVIELLSDPTLMFLELT